MKDIEGLREYPRVVMLAFVNERVTKFMNFIGLNHNLNLINQLQSYVIHFMCEYCSITWYHLKQSIFSCILDFIILINFSTET